MVTLREFGACSCKASCAGNGCSIGKCDNVAAVRSRPCPKGLIAEATRSKALSWQVDTCLRKFASIQDSAVSQSGHRFDKRLLSVAASIKDFRVRVKISLCESEVVSYESK